MTSPFGSWTRRRIAMAAVAVLAVLALGAFLAFRLAGDPTPEATGDERIVQPGAPGQPGRTLSADDLPSLRPPEHTAADVRFMQRMIPHHAQALEMTAMVAGRAASADVPRLAERIEVSQRDEIAQMERWLRDRGEDLPEPHANHAGHDTLMPGMLNDEQLARLERARGPEFDRLFLELMIRHHRGAVTMVHELYADGGGVEPASDRFAREVEADQNIEISRMTDLLGTLTG